jgi:hypothetical protein
MCSHVQYTVVKVSIALYTYLPETLDPVGECIVSMRIFAFDIISIERVQCMRGGLCLNLLVVTLLYFFITVLGTQCYSCMILTVHFYGFKGAVA